eukprot:5926197-Pleurochrysis_carterae.AAC.2
MHSLISAAIPTRRRCHDRFPVRLNSCRPVVTDAEDLILVTSSQLQSGRQHHFLNADATQSSKMTEQAAPEPHTPKPSARMLRLAKSSQLSTKDAPIATR